MMRYFSDHHRKNNLKPFQTSRFGIIRTNTQQNKMNFSCFEIPTTLSPRNCKIVILIVCVASTWFSFGSTVGGIGLWAPQSKPGG